jgi:hypothetical protein
LPAGANGRFAEASGCTTDLPAGVRVKLLDLGAGERLRRDQVVERLHGERFAVDHLAGRLATGRIGEGECRYEYRPGS